MSNRIQSLAVRFGHVLDEKLYTAIKELVIQVASVCAVEGNYRPVLIQVMKK